MKSPNYKIVLSLLSLSLSIFADVKPAVLFIDGMVIQRDIQAPIWGKAAPGEKVVVTGSWGESEQTVADNKGKWLVKIQTPHAGGPHRLTIKGSNSVEIKDVLSGEVWLCSGQSNMAYRLNNLLPKVKKGSSKSGNDYIRKEIDTADDKLFRQFSISLIPKKADLNKGWITAETGQVGDFSGAGYFFGRELRSKLKVPVGLILGAVCGSSIEPWIPESGYQSDKVMAEYFKIPRKDARHKRPAGLFNIMIQQAIPYAIKGAIWYQGESNVNKETVRYETHFKALITSWRALWGQGDFPFYYAQLANFRGLSKEPVEYDNWALICEQQRRALSLKNTGMAVLSDIGEPKNIHPKNKIDVGKRLAAWALKKDYGVNLKAWSGPLYKSYDIKNGKMIITFDHVGSGLMAGSKHQIEATKETSDPLKCFQICGKDRNWQWAEAKISGKNTVEVLHADIAEPAIVRYAWSINSVGANLYNKEGFPASLFTTEMALPDAKPVEPSEDKSSGKSKKKKKK
jgi:sialate O-acetylesterase